MNIIFITHPDFLGSNSMPRYAKWLMQGMLQRGHNVKKITAKPKIYNIPIKRWKKWFGYVDQYILFPIELKKIIKNINIEDTLFVFTDHALGPWVPIVKKYSHIIHCHDFLAQKSSIGEINENITNITGKFYQSYIRRGFKKGENFISISYQTKDDLETFLKPKTPVLSEVVYNGLNQNFQKLDKKCAIEKMQEYLGIGLNDGYFLHVGGNQWYKNRRGVIKIYTAVRKNDISRAALILIGKNPDKALVEEYEKSNYKHDIHFLVDVPDNMLNAAYSGCQLFIFPSLAEGFGWPIAEAMASGSMVLTTNEAPMNEVGGEAAFYCERMPSKKGEINKWANQISKNIRNYLNLNHVEKEDIEIKAKKNIQRFNSEGRLDDIESIYKEVLIKSGIVK